MKKKHFFTAILVFLIALLIISCPINNPTDDQKDQNRNLQFINKEGRYDDAINVSKINNNIVIDTGDDQGDLYLVISNTSMETEKAPDIKGYKNAFAPVPNIVGLQNQNIISYNEGFFYDTHPDVKRSYISKDEVQTDVKKPLLSKVSLQSEVTPKKSKYYSLKVGDQIVLGNDGQPDTPGLWVLGKNDNFKKVNATLREKRTVSTKFGDKTLLIFVEDDMWDTKGARLNETFVKAQADAFLKEGVDNDIYDWMTSIFNTEWSDFSSSIGESQIQAFNNRYGSNSSQGFFIDNTDEIVLFYADIYDQGEASKSGGVVGYYSLVNNWVNEYLTKKYYNVYSNEAVILNLNAYFSSFHPEKALSTLAHEFQHAIHYHHREAKKGFVLKGGDVYFYNNSSTWINEMCSSIAEEIIAKKIGVMGPGNNDKNTGDYSEYDLNYGRIVEYIAGSKCDVTDWENVRKQNSLYPYGLVYSLGGYLLRNFNTDFIKNIYSSNLTEYHSDETVREDSRDFLLNIINASNNSNYTWGDILRMWGVAVLMSDNYSAPKNYVYSIKNSNSDYWFKNLFNTKLNIPSNNYFVYKNNKNSLIREMWEGGEALPSTGPYIYNSQADRPYSKFVNNDINPNTNTFVLLEKGVSGKKIYNIDVSDFNTSKLKFTFVKK